MYQEVNFYHFKSQLFETLKNNAPVFFFRSRMRRDPLTAAIHIQILYHFAALHVKRIVHISAFHFTCIFPSLQRCPVYTRFESFVYNVSLSPASWKFSINTTEVILSQ